MLKHILHYLITIDFSTISVFAVMFSFWGKNSIYVDKRFGHTIQIILQIGHIVAHTYCKLQKKIVNYAKVSAICETVLQCNRRKAYKKKKIKL